ncbi:MAG: Calx-beta domain-containing protein [Verrucomicrobiota bacterium]
MNLHLASLFVFLTTVCPLLAGPAAPVPTILTVDNQANKALITGTYQGASNQAVTINLYRSSSGPTGATLFKSVPITTDGAGAGSFDMPLGANFGGYTLYASATVSGTTSALSNGPLVPMRFRFSKTATTVSEAVGQLTVVIYRDGVLSSPETIEIATENGTARSGIDFQIPDSPIIFAPLASSGTATVPIIQNSILDTERSFVVALVPSASQTVSQGRMTVTIADDESIPAPTLLAVDNVANQAWITGAYHGEPNQTLTLSLYRSAPGLSGTTSFKTISLATDNEGNTEINTPAGANLGGYTIYASVKAASGASSALSNGLQIPTRYRLISSTATVSEAAGRLEVIVHRDGNVSNSASIGVTTENGTARAGTDFQVPNPQVVFSPLATTGTATIPIINNSILDTVRSFAVALVPSPGEVVSLGRTTVTITDDESIPAPTLLTVDNLTNQALISGTYHGPANQTLALGLYRSLSGPTGATPFKLLSLTTNSAGNAAINALAGANLGGYTFYASVKAASGAASVLSNGLAIPTRYRLAKPIAIVSEAAGHLALTVHRDGNVSTSGTIGIVTENGTAKSGIDYLQPLVTSLVFAPGVTTGTATIPILKNSTIDGERSFLVSLRPKANSVANLCSTIVNIIDDVMAGGLIGFASGTFRANESARNAVFTIQRSGGLGNTAYVRYILTPETARTPTDFIVPISNVIKFAAFQTSATVVVPTVPHTKFDSPKTFTMTLLSGTNVSDGAALANSPALPRIARATICDDSNPKGAVQFTVSNLGVVKNAGSAKLTLTRLGGASGTVSVRYATSDLTARANTDYTPMNGLVTFAPDQRTATVSIPLVNDALFEKPETFRVTLSSPANGATLAAQDRVDVTIVDDDNPNGVLQFATAALSVSEKAGAAKIAVNRLGGAASVASVHYATWRGTATSGFDYISEAGTLTFYEGQRTAIITVPIIMDTLLEPAENFTVTLSNPTNGAVLGPQKTVTVTLPQN